jgi:hypothetical protein
MSKSFYLSYYKPNTAVKNWIICQGNSNIPLSSVATVVIQ